MDIIKVENLKKAYNRSFALQDISFSIKEEMIYALLGVNGAGKTTIINILATLIEKTSGKLFIKGIKGTNIAKEIGIVFQDGVLDKSLTVKENIFSRAKMLNMDNSLIESRLISIAKHLSLSDKITQRYDSLSGGERRKADILRALIHSPKILILDEPTTGLDPASRYAFWQSLIRIKKAQNLTILFSTHYMAEAEIADKIIIIDKGKNVITATPNQIINEYAKSKLKIFSRDNNRVIRLLADYNVKTQDQALIVEIKNNKEALIILNSISELLIDYEIIKGSLESAFINITNS